MPDWGAADTFQAQACTGGFGLVQASYETTRQAVPAAFDVDGYTPATALIHLLLGTCERVTANATVLEDVSFFRLEAIVTPLNESWRSDHPHYYVLASLASDPVAAKLLGPAGASQEATFERAAVAGGSLETWKVTSADCKFTFAFLRTGEPGLQRSDVFHHWTGENPFRRAEETKSVEYEGRAHASDLLADGSCAGAQAVGPTAPYVSQPYKFESAWTMSPEEFA